MSKRRRSYPSKSRLQRVAVSSITTGSSFEKLGSRGVRESTKVKISAATRNDEESALRLVLSGN
jgi:hypothetical protein